MGSFLSNAITQNQSSIASTTFTLQTHPQQLTKTTNRLVTKELLQAPIQQSTFALTANSVTQETTPTELSIRVGQVVTQATDPHLQYILLEMSHRVFHTPSLSKEHETLLTDLLQPLLPEEREKLLYAAVFMEGSWMFYTLTIPEMIKCISAARHYTNQDQMIVFSTSLSVQHMSCDERIACMNALASVRDDLRYHAWLLMSQLNDLTSPAANRLAVIQAIARHANVIGLEGINAMMSLFTKDMSAQDRLLIATEIAKKPSKLFPLTQQLFTPTMSTQSKIALLQSLNACQDEHEYQIHCRILFRIKSMSFAINQDDIGFLANSLLKIPAHEREMIVDYALPFLHQGMNISRDLIALIFNIAQIVPCTKENISQILDFARQIAPQGSSLSDVGLIVKYINYIPMENREKIITTYILPSLPPNTSARTRVTMLVIICRVAIENIPKAISNWKQHKLPRLLKDPERAYNQIIIETQSKFVEYLDLHKGDRDKYTRNAYECLCATQKFFSNQDIETNATAFTQHLLHLPKNERTKQALRALLAPQDLDETFGPLLDDKIFVVSNLAISGKEVIARLWQFSQNLNEPERTIVIEGMISALAESISLYDQRICNEGKLQQLLLYTIQGRIPGVMIDADDMTKHISAAESSAMFFEANHGYNKTIENWQELWDTAKEFCAANDRVPKKDFLQLIEDYARIQGIYPEETNINCTQDLVK